MTDTVTKIGHKTIVADIAVSWLSRTVEHNFIMTPPKSGKEDFMQKFQSYIRHSTALIS